MTPEKLFLLLLERCLAAGWLVLAIMILRPFLRRVSRSLCCALWGLVAFRLLCPFSFESVFSLLPRSKIIPTDLASGQTLISNGFFPTMGQPEEILGSSTSVINPAVASHTQVLLQVLTGIWLVGFSLFILYALISTLRLHIRVRDSVKQEDGYWLCDWVSFPFVFGVFRPRIILPFNVDERDIPYILAHERAHLTRHDHWRKPIAFLLLAVFWFQPVFWIAYYLLRRDVEFACDERAIRMLGADKECKASYAKALLQSSSQHSYVAKLSSPLAFGGLQVKRRVSSVLKYRKPAAARMLAAILVCVALAACFLTDPKGDASAPQNEPQTTEQGTSNELTTQPTEKPTERPSVMPPKEESEEDPPVWYLSEIMDFFVGKQGGDPVYILNWAIDAAERRGIELIYDIDPYVYIDRMQNH